MSFAIVKLAIFFLNNPVFKNKESPLATSAELYVIVALSLLITLSTNEIPSGTIKSPPVSYPSIVDNTRFSSLSV